MKFLKLFAYIKIFSVINCEFIRFGQNLNDYISEIKTALETLNSIGGYAKLKIWQKWKYGNLTPVCWRTLIDNSSLVNFFSTEEIFRRQRCGLVSNFREKLEDYYTAAEEENKISFNRRFGTGENIEISENVQSQASNN